MITENLSTLKINKLSQAQYDRELAAGNLETNALYLTPDDEAMDLTSDQTASGVKTFSNGINIGDARLVFDNTLQALVISFE